MHITCEYGQITIDDSPEVRDAVFLRVVKFLTHTGCWHPESVMQNDVATLEAPELLIGLLDDLQPEVTYVE